MAIRLIQRRPSKFMLGSKIGLIPRSTIQESTFSATDLHASSCKAPTISHPISTISALQKRFYFKNREYDDQWRFFFKNRAYQDDQGHWFHNPKRVRLTLFLFTFGALLGVSSGESITVPYNERSHFVLFHKFIPKILSDKLDSFEARPRLPPLHPDKLTAQRVFRDIIHQASQIQLETTPVRSYIQWRSSLDNWKKQDAEETGEKTEKFEIIVVDSRRIAAASTGASGKVYVTSGMVRHYRRHDAMIATVFGHEVGHTLAAHYEELISKFVCLMSGMGMSFYLFSKSAYFRSKWSYFDKFMRLRFLPSFSLVVAVPLLAYLPMMIYWRKIELEADYIGLMLASSAGYNPLVGVAFAIYGVKLRKRPWPKYFYPVPSGEERIEILTHPQIISEAVSRHRQGTALRQGTEPPDED